MRAIWSSCRKRRCADCRWCWRTRWTMCSRRRWRRSRTSSGPRLERRRGVMAQVDFQHREIAIKLVYYGPALSGKTTNLQKIHERMDPKRRGRLLTLDTKEDRTLYFDLLPLAFKSASGVTCKVKLFTVPGQVMHNTTRKVVLQGCDGVAFIADSQIAETKNNNESFANLRQNMRENKLDAESVPIVIQFNKRDLPKVRTDAEIKQIAT